ncbi:MAG: FG-GAP-like repeat-containing protein, partial [Bacteroidota bacterium]
DGFTDIFLTGEVASGNVSSSEIFFRQGPGISALYQQDTASSNLFADFSNSHAAWGDFDNDKKLDLMLTGINLTGPSISYHYYRNIEPSANVSPLAPAPSSLSANLQGFDVLLDWDASLAAAGLPAGANNGYTYNVYVDTVPPAQVVHTPLADTSSGQRRIVRIGNAGSKTEFLAQDLIPNTTYYWGVQAIDQDFEGSIFSRGGSFFYDDPSFLDQTDNVVLSTSQETFEDAYLRWGDYNENGELDLLLVGGRNTNDYGVYFLEQDGGIFTEDLNIIGNIDAVRFGSIDLADADSDGEIDILIAGESASGPICKVYRDLQSGQGASFGGINAGDIFSVPGGGIRDGEAIFGDYNNDGLPDILMTGNRNGNPVTELYRNESTLGNLAFSLDPISTTLTNMFNSAAVWADFNNDGWLDFAIQGENATTSFQEWYRNDQNGSFTSFNLPGQDILGGSLKAGDFDADGWIDLLSTGELLVGSPRTEVLRNNANGTFSLFQNLPFLEKGSADWADFNHDGYLDVALVGEDLGNNSTDAHFLIYDPALPNNNFVDDPIAAVPFPRVGKDSYLAWGDYDEDGRIDLAIAGYSGAASGGALSILQNINQNTQIPAPQPANLSAQVVGNEVLLSWDHPAAYALPTKSLSYNVSVRRSGTQIVSPESDVVDGWRQIVKIGSVHDTTTFRLQNLQPGTYDWAVQAITSDYEGGPFTSIASFDYQPPSFEEVTADILPFIPPGLRDVSMAWGDFGNDGDLDLAIMGETAAGTPFSRLYGANAGNFDTIPLSLPQLAEGDLAWADIDQDNDLDLIMSGRDASGTPQTFLLENQGASFNSIAANIADLYQSALAWGDLDIDGDLDLVIMGDDGTNAITQVYRNNGNNTFSDINASLLDLKNGDLALLDYNKDGFLDLLVIGELTNGTPERVFYDNDGQANFSQNSIVPGNTNVPALSNAVIAVTDYNFDGYPDLAISGTSSSGPIARLLNYNTLVNQYNIDQFLSNLDEGSLAWGDFDDDGSPDLLQTGRSSANVDSTVLYRFDGSNYTSTLFPALPLQNVGSSSDAIWGDFDQDGKLDIVLSGTTGSGPVSPVMHWYRNIDTVNQNIVPALPTNLSESVSGDTLILQWTPPTGFDPAQVKGLSYQLCVGTTSSNASIYAPMSQLSDGYRQIVRREIAGGADTIKYKLTNLVDDTYFWSVQTIDQDFEGSTFPTKRSIAFTNPAFVNTTAFSVPGGFDGAMDANVSMADYDNDGQLEFLVLGAEISNNVGTFYEQQPDGTYAEDASNSVPALRHASADWADVNGDGWLDLTLIGDPSVGANAASPLIRYYQNNGSGVLQQQAALVSGISGLHRGALDWADYDRDGDLDLAIMGSQGNSPQPFTRIYR